jgi:putative lipoic acid-binding regulatory protein
MGRSHIVVQEPVTFERTTLIEYPCDFPIKVMGVNADGFQQAVFEAVSRHAPDFNPAATQIRPSGKGNYLSLTCTFRAHSQAQVDALYHELTAHPLVKVVL